eukprot:CAMPEP_0115010020 /NCGR_PEP_ID=MMETSP0216-20121206/23027_1 /TAXON_ID=223996 /ORGANISM="Protocruzia adherens, Strain Boccale" /LENGTH=56 /DNA_ID=CAMNT_0002378075 /DNA_START=11 /DNA_END=178 /DNA_ORIENTATION=+
MGTIGLDVITTSTPRVANGLTSNHTNGSYIVSCTSRLLARGGSRIACGQCTRSIDK